MTPDDGNALSDRMVVDPRYVEARRVLLDALSALAPHGSALVVAGAQAVYLRTGDGDIAVGPYTTDIDLAVAVSPFTTDGDLVVDPSSLLPDPAIETAMTEAGFQLATSRQPRLALGPRLALRSAVDALVAKLRACRRSGALTCNVVGAVLVGQARERAATPGASAAVRSERRGCAPRTM